MWYGFEKRHQYEPSYLVAHTYSWLHIEIFIDVYIHSLVYLHTIFLLCLFKGPRSNDTSIAMNTPSYRSYFLILVSKKKENDSLEKQLILGLTVGNMQNKMEYFVVSERSTQIKNITQEGGM